MLITVQLDDDPDDLISAIAKTLEDVPGPLPWDQRIVLGCWNVSAIHDLVWPMSWSHHFYRQRFCRQPVASSPPTPSPTSAPPSSTRTTSCRSPTSASTCSKSHSSGPQADTSFARSKRPTSSSSCGRSTRSGGWSGASARTWVATADVRG